jgi:hypothetical protein
MTLRSTLFGLWMIAITAGVGFVVVRDAPVAKGAPAAPTKLTLDELDVHRINVIEPDGKPRVILASRRRLDLLRRRRHRGGRPDLRHAR